jgi:hypothetical protein
MRQHPLVMRCDAFAKSFDEREAVITRAGAEVDNLVQAQVGNWVENALRRFPTQLATRESSFGSALYTVVFAGWNVGFASAEADGWLRSAPPDTSALADAAIDMRQHLDLDELSDPVWYALDNMRGYWAAHVVAIGIGLDFDQLVNEEWTEELVMLADEGLLWGFCIGQAEPRI